MNVEVNPGLGMSLFSIIPILSIILNLVKELFLIFFLFKGIQVANVYLNNNKME